MSAVPSSVDLAAVRQYLTGLQERIAAALAAIDGQPFRADTWQRPEGGGGVSRVIEEGGVFERGGVNFSHVTGKTLPPSATAARPSSPVAPGTHSACRSFCTRAIPYAPTVHMNVRFFVAHAAGAAAPVWWFGGGMDLTPYYGYADDAIHFHGACRDALAPFGADVYRALQKMVRRVFFSQAPGRAARHRRDLLRRSEHARLCNAASSCSKASATIFSTPTYRCSSAAKRSLMASTNATGRLIGAAVTSNSIWCGTAARLFGLQSGGRTESILMSLPPVVKWRYDWHPAPGSAEAALLSEFLIGKNWL